LTGIVARHLAERVGYEPVEEAFVAGLIHDMGKLVFLRCAPGTYTSLLAETRDSATLVRRERAVFGLSHLQAGRRLADRWDLPDVFQRAVGEHDVPEPGGRLGPGASLVPITVAANELARRVERDPTGNELRRAWADDPTWCGLPAETLADLAGEIARAYSEYVSMFGLTDALGLIDAPLLVEQSAPPPDASVVPAAATVAGPTPVDRSALLGHLRRLAAILIATEPADDPAELVLTALTTAVGWPQAVIWRVDADGRRLELTRSRGWPPEAAPRLPSVPLAAADRYTLVSALRKRDETVLEHAEPGSTDGDRDLLAALDCAILLVLPLCDRERPLGALGLAARAAALPSAEQLAAARTLADTLALAFGRELGPVRVGERDA
jgi:hypothetical protein